MSVSLIKHSLTFFKESKTEFFIKPLFIDIDIREIVDIRLNIKTAEKLDFIDNLEKITKKYARGTAFTSATGVTITQKTLTVSRAKAQVAQAGEEFLDWVKQEFLKRGVDENNIEDTIFEEIVLTIYMQGLQADLRRQMWFNDPAKEDVVSGVPDGNIDDDYDIYKGFWKLILDDFDSVLIPAAQKIDLNSTTFLATAAVKQVDTTTLTGTSGTANITVNGTAYLATFDTSLTITATNFVTAHAAAILARHGNIVVTSSGADVIFTAGIAGLEQSVSNAVNATGDLAGTTAATVANVPTGALKADAGIAALKTVYNAMPAVMKNAKDQLRFLTTGSVVDNFRDSMESPTAGSESAYTAIIEGVKRLAYRNIPLVELLDWDKRIEADFGSQQPHRILLVLPKNLVLGVDGEADETNIESWYEKKDQERVFRAEYKMGTQYIHPDFIVIGIA